MIQIFINQQTGSIKCLGHAEVGKHHLSEAAWRRSEFERGYQDGFKSVGYRPTSLLYIEGYESGELAAIRNRHR